MDASIDGAVAAFSFRNLVMGSLHKNIPFPFCSVINNRVFWNPFRFRSALTLGKAVPKTYHEPTVCSKDDPPIDEAPEGARQTNRWARFLEEVHVRRHQFTLLLIFISS